MITSLVKVNYSKSVDLLKTECGMRVKRGNGRKAIFEGGNWL